MEDGTKFRVRETPEWKKHAADLEAEMLKRGMMFEVIDWSEDQATLPFEQWFLGPLEAFPRRALGVSSSRSFNNLRNVTNLRNIRSLDVPISRFSR
jgi:hypothetical protein